MIFAGHSLTARRIVDLGAEHCLEWDESEFFHFVKVTDGRLGRMKGVGGTSAPVTGHGHIGEWVRLDDGKSLLVVFYARCMPTVRRRLRSGFTLATCGMKQETELHGTNVRTRLIHTDAKGHTEHSTCDRFGRLFATLVEGMAKRNRQLSARLHI